MVAGRLAVTVGERRWVGGGRWGGREVEGGVQVKRKEGFCIIGQQMAALVQFLIGENLCLVLFFQ